MKALLLVLVAACDFTKHGHAGASADAAPPPADAAADAASIDAAPDAAEASPCQAHQLVASRTYGIIPLFFDANITDLGGKRAMLPASLPVSQGNGANRCMRITFQNELIGTTQCLYKGNATVDHVGDDPIETAAGLSYTLRHCKSGIAISFPDCGGLDIGTEEPFLAGDPVPFRGLTVRVDDGDDEKGTTQVTVVVDICDV